MTDAESARVRFGLLSVFLDERLRRLVAAAESVTLGYGGVSKVSRATGVSRRAITEGVKELQSPLPQVRAMRGPRVRREGGGRKKVLEKDPALARRLERLVEPVTRGDPISPLRWTCKSVRRLATELNQQEHSVSHQTVAALLGGLGYSLQANRKTREGSSHPDRNAQFEYLNQKVQQYWANGQPVISVDTKKKELVGDFKNGGREVRPKGKPEEVRVHDFEIPSLGKVAPYGVYD
ncbi:MAG: ISAzo13 family transposase, partial [Terriglobia bacterium]